jgi:hypothetical protein
MGKPTENTFETSMHFMMLNDPTVCDVMKNHGVTPTNIFMVEIPRGALQELVMALFAGKQALARELDLHAENATASARFGD